MVGVDDGIDEGGNDENTDGCALLTTDGSELGVKLTLEEGKDDGVMDVVGLDDDIIDGWEDGVLDA